MQTKQMRKWFFTLNNTEELNLEENYKKHVDRLTEIFELITKPKWIFQLERGSKAGRLHFGGRLCFKNPVRISEVIKKLDKVYKTIDLFIEHDEKASIFYNMKRDETYVDGPWSHEEQPLYIPRQIREIVELHPWQKSLIEKSQKWDTRHINIIYDTEGNIGKSTLCTYMGVNRFAKLLPFCNDYKDILRMCYDVGVYKTYLIDMPRAINKERLYQFFAAIETIKSGYCYDDRFKFKDRYFDCPNIFVFTNSIPDTEMLSQDRWKYWTIIDFKLIPYKTLWSGGSPVNPDQSSI